MLCMEYKNLRAEDIAPMLLCSKATAQKIIRGEPPSKKMAEALRRVFGINPDSWLLEAK